MLFIPFFLGSSGPGSLRLAHPQATGGWRLLRPQRGPVILSTFSGTGSRRSGICWVCCSVVLCRHGNPQRLQSGSPRVLGAGVGLLLSPYTRGPCVVTSLCVLLCTALMMHCGAGEVAFRPTQATPVSRVWHPSSACWRLRASVYVWELPSPLGSPAAWCSKNNLGYGERRARFTDVCLHARFLAMLGLFSYLGSVSHTVHGQNTSWIVMCRKISQSWLSHPVYLCASIFLFFFFCLLYKLSWISIVFSEWMKLPDEWMRHPQREKVQGVYCLVRKLQNSWTES